MGEGWVGGDLAEEANDAFAAAYDDFNHRYQYERWTRVLLDRAESSGLSEDGRRLLDVGCGTGLSFLPMLERGWSVVACDVAPRMVEAAAAKASGRAAVVVADMRELPRLGQFDLVWAVNDAMNYLLSSEELVAALTGMRLNLAVGGKVLFDLNTLESYRTFFAEEFAVERNGRRFLWSGEVEPEAAKAGMTAEARFESSDEPGSGHVHHQRHFGEEEVREAIAAAGLSCLDVAGELEGDLSTPLDEDRHSKAVYVCEA